MKAEAKQFVRTTIDLPARLNEKLMREAEKNKRSRHAQMIVALEQFFETAVPAALESGRKNAVGKF